MAKFKRLETVRVIGQRVGGINEFAMVKHITEDGKYWIANMNMPFAGTISAIVDENKIEKV